MDNMDKKTPSKEEQQTVRVLFALMGVGLLVFAVYVLSNGIQAFVAGQITRGLFSILTLQITVLLIVYCFGMFRKPIDENTDG